VADVVVAFQGWDASGVGWGEQPWGEGVLDIKAIGAVGSVVVSIDEVVLVSGVGATAFLGQITVTADADVSVTGVEATGQVGEVTINGDANVLLTGVEGTMALGSVTVAANADVFATGVQAVGQVGSVDHQADVEVSVTGVVGTAAIGTVIAEAGSDVPVTGLQATASVGSVTAGAGQASIEFSSIPGIYTDLKLVLSGRKSTTALDVISVSLNGGGTAINGNKYLDSNNTGTPRSGTAVGYQFLAQPSDYTASVFSNSEMYIPNYTVAQNKSLSIDTVAENNATGSFLGFTISLWPSTAAITTITLTNSTGNFVQYSSASLYGIKKS